MKNIVFIHGMFQNPKSWGKWMNYFTAKGYACVAPAWPYHDGEPAALRSRAPEGLGDLSLNEVVNKYRTIVSGLTEPILIGHSVGGLIVQLLINQGYGAAGVCISSVAPNSMLAFDWGFFKNSMTITNPLKGNQPFYTDLETFHESFCNTMSMEETKVAFETYATHDSRNVMRDCMGEAGQLDLDIPHPPLLFISAEKDQIIPPELCEKNSEAYTDAGSSTFYEMFPNRGHFICGEPGWQEVAASVHEWLQSEAVSGHQATTSAVL